MLIVLALDLFVFHKKAHAVAVKEAATWTAVWVTLSLLFNAWVWHWKGTNAGIEFLTGYVIEYSLSMDNILVFVVVMSYFRVPPQYQHRLLVWGVIGAFVLRGVMIGLGVAIVHRFHWVLYLFGAFLVFTGIKLLFPSRPPTTRGCALRRELRARLGLTTLSSKSRGDTVFCSVNAQEIRR